MATATVDRPPGQGAPLEPEPRGGRRRSWTVVTRCAVALVLATEAVLAAPHLRSALASLAQVSRGWVGVAVVATAASLTAFALVRRRLLRAADVRVSTASSLGSILVSNAFHMTLPGGVAFSTGYSYRWMRERGAGITVAGWCLAVNGLLSTASLAGLGLAASLLTGGGSVARLVLHAAGLAVLVLGARHLVRHPERALSVAGTLLAAANRLLHRPPTAGAQRLTETAAQLRSVRPGAGDWTAASGFALLNWVFDLACLVACAQATGMPDLPPAVVVAAYVAGMATSGLSLLPGGLGVVDAALVLGLVAGGSPAAAALSAVVLYRLISLVGVVAVGWGVHAAQRARPSDRPAGRRAGPHAGPTPADLAVQRG
jgi:putative heme transporter